MEVLGHVIIKKQKKQRKEREKKEKEREKKGRGREGRLEGRSLGLKGRGKTVFIFLLSDDIILYVENPKESTKITKTNK